LKKEFSIIVIQSDKNISAKLEYQLNNFGYDSSFFYSSIDEFKNHQGKFKGPFLIIKNRTSLNFDLSVFQKLSNFQNNSILISYSAEVLDDGLWPDENFKMKMCSEENNINDCFKSEEIYYYQDCPLEEELFQVIGVNGVPVAIKNDFIPSDLYRPALFLDRDGIINIDKSYMYKEEEVEIYPSSIELIKYFNDRSYPVCVITNQSGVAREKYSISDVEKLHEYMSNELLKKGAKVDGWYISPYHEVSNGNQFDKKSLMRKPFPAMALDAAKDLPIRFDKSYMIGDKSSDFLLLDNQGIETFHIQRQYDLSDAKGKVCKDLKEALLEIKKVLE